MDKSRKDIAHSVIHTTIGELQEQNLIFTLNLTWQPSTALLETADETAFSFCKHRLNERVRASLAQSSQRPLLVEPSIALPRQCREINIWDSTSRAPCSWRLLYYHGIATLGISQSSCPTTRLVTTDAGLVVLRC